MQTDADLKSIVIAARSGDDAAFEHLIRRFQDMAFGFCFACLKDFQLAEDAAQESFAEVYVSLRCLREATAFVPWFRCILFKQCDRVLRRSQLPVTDIGQAAGLASQDLSVANTLEVTLIREQVRCAVADLPPAQRLVTSLYYFGGYSQAAIAQFLGLPPTTVKKRLYAARRNLSVMLKDLAEINYQNVRPSRDEVFASQVRAMARKLAGIYRSPYPSHITSSLADSVINLLRWQVNRAEATLDVVKDRGEEMKFGNFQDGLSALAGVSHVARLNQILLNDSAQSIRGFLRLPSDLILADLDTVGDAWEFLFEREHDAPQDILCRLKAVNKHWEHALQLLPGQAWNEPISTLLYGQQQLRDLALILLEQGSFSFGHTWAVIKMHAYGAKIEK